MTEKRNVESEKIRAWLKEFEQEFQDQQAAQEVKALATQVETYLAEAAQREYKPQPENLQKFMEVSAFFQACAKELGGKITFLDFKPEALHAGITMEVPLLDLYQESLQAFAKMASQADVLGITPTADGGLLVEAGVNQVWQAE